MKTLREVYIENEKQNFIDSSLYARYNVKAGLRNENGTGVKVGLTKICDVVGYRMIHGQKINLDGQLIFRGYEVNTLTKLDNAYEKTAFLLIFGKLPTEKELESFHHALMFDNKTDLVDETYTTKNILNALQIDVLKLYGLDENPDSDTLDQRMIKGLSILSSIPLFVFSNYHHKKITKYPCPEKSFAENILYLLRQSPDCTPQEVKVLDILLVLHADHGGGNNSTFANVVISSTGTDIYSCISAAIGSLKGPRHGGANAKVYAQFQEIFNTVGITTDEEVLTDIARKLLHKEFFDKSGLIYGIGHAIYTKSDPRARAIRGACHQLAIEKNQEDKYLCLEAFERCAIRVMKEEKGIEACSNVDFYSGLAYAMLGFEPDLFTPLFCIARTAGWVAHHLENRQSNRKLIRPANVYVGDKQKEGTE